MGQKPAVKIRYQRLRNTYIQTKQNILSISISEILDNGKEEILFGVSAIASLQLERPIRKTSMCKINLTINKAN